MDVLVNSVSLQEDPEKNEKQSIKLDLTHKRTQAQKGKFHPPIGPQPQNEYILVFYVI